MQPVSFVVLINRAEMVNEKTIEYATRLNTAYPTTIGFAGEDTQLPSRNDVLKSFKDRTSFFSFVDNAESPSGRAALLIAHSQNILGKRGIFGVSANASSPAPELSAQ